MRQRDERGASLAWAMLLLAIVSTAIAVSGGAIAARMRCARLAAESGAMQDLHSSGAALGRVRAADPRWRGPETLQLEGGSVTIHLEDVDTGGLLIVASTARLTGRVSLSSVRLGSPRPVDLPPVPQPLGLTARY